MTKSDLIQELTHRQPDMSQRDVELAVGLLQKTIVRELAEGGRVEIRGFGSFSVNHRPARRGRNPKTGAPVDIPEKYVPHFKPGKALAQRVDNDE
ncbi:integration host factor subunit beta [Salinisphaera sp. USBA-960]|uniref:integration host factor subunit beta n=1 Tax=Salinisphaera orenii TaxID=856731 RepID=UPI000DBE308B|nr:integration host factor subunit beta [Salifodinibacter halophilus]NNC26384.1 integration host factor subunit beta [Salifodinibacter halophilus]